jgi:hypothetical protein
MSGSARVARRKPGPPLHAPPEAMQLVSIKSQVTGVAALGRTRPAVSIKAVKAVAAAVRAIVDLRMFCPLRVTIIIRLTWARMIASRCTRPRAQNSGAIYMPSETLTMKSH